VPNIRLIIEYDGAGFHGWQKQGELRTIQVELGKVLSIILRCDVGTLHAAGRTDSGVHARGQVVTFKFGEVPDLRRLAQGVSHLMKGEVAVLSADVVPDSFHPGRDSTHKQYTYCILTRDAPAVLDARRVWHVHRRLDLALMRECAAQVIGEHDFTSFQDSDCCAKSPIKTIYSSQLLEEGDLLLYRVIGSGFLKQMVRNITGTLVDIGRGTLKTRSCSEILGKLDRRVAGMTAPAHGLCLDWVSYDSIDETSFP
jgi:tRNA pseudouridine38-40 synthase